MSTVLIILAFQLAFLPIQLIAWWGLRKENERRERILKISLRALGLIVVSKGRRTE